MNVLLVVNCSRIEAVQDALMLETWLKRQGYDVAWAPDMRAGDSADAAAPAGVGPGLAAAPTLDAATLETAELVISLGGDGTLLRAARIVGTRGIPILGLSYGHLGFLTAANPADVNILEVVADALAGEMHVSRRATLSADIVPVGACGPAADVMRVPAVPAAEKRPSVAVAGAAASGAGEPPQPLTVFALNDLALTRGALGEMIEVEITVSGHRIDKLRGDGIVVSTATGSTGYALSAGGPIVSPDYTGMVCVPIAPHTIQARAFLTSPSDVVELALDYDRPTHASVQVDGQVLECPGDIARVVVRRGPGDVLLLDYGPESFYSSVSRVFYGVRRDD